MAEPNGSATSKGTEYHSLLPRLTFTCSWAAVWGGQPPMTQTVFGVSGPNPARSLNFPCSGRVTAGNVQRRHSVSGLKSTPMAPSMRINHSPLADESGASGIATSAWNSLMPAGRRISQGTAVGPSHCPFRRGKIRPCSLAGWAVLPARWRGNRTRPLLARENGLRQPDLRAGRHHDGAM